MGSRLKKILVDHGYENLHEFLSKDLSESQLNSLLIDVFNARSKSKDASQLLRDYSENRFAKPASIDPIRSRELELESLRIVKKANFEIIEFSPLTPFGTSSIHGGVSQNNVVSSTRRMEVVSDVTNVMALEIAKRLLANKKLDKINLAASQRQVRAQSLHDPKHTAHFKVIAMTSSWLDKGKYHEEEKQAITHIKTYVRICENVYNLSTENLVLHILIRGIDKDIDYKRFVHNVSDAIPGLSVDVKYNMDTTNIYYEHMRFGLKIKSNNYSVVDGGFVSWMRNLTQNKKRKCLISGIGTEILSKI